jgi:hypothetical protein
LSMKPFLNKYFKKIKTLIRFGSRKMNKDL